MSLFKFLISDYSPPEVAKTNTLNNDKNLVESAKNVRRITIEEEGAPLESAKPEHKEESVDYYLEHLKQPTPELTLKLCARLCPHGCPWLSEFAKRGAVGLLVNYLGTLLRGQREEDQVMVRSLQKTINHFLTLLADEPALNTQYEEERRKYLELINEIGAGNEKRNSAEEKSMELSTAREEEREIETERENIPVKLLKVRKLTDEWGWLLFFDDVQLLVAKLLFQKDLSGAMKAYREFSLQVPIQYQGQAWCQATHCCLKHWLSVASCPLYRLASLPRKEDWNYPDSFYAFFESKFYYLARGGQARDLRASTFSITKLQEKLGKSVVKETEGVGGSESGECESVCLIESLSTEQLEIITQYTNSSLYGEEIREINAMIDKDCNALLQERRVFASYQSDFYKYLKRKLSAYLRLFLQVSPLLDELKWEEEKALMESQFLAILDPAQPQLNVDDISQLKQMISMNSHNLSSPTIINLQKIIDAFAPHFPDIAPNNSKFYYGYDFNHFLERLTKHQEKQQASFNMDYVDDVHNLFNHAYRFLWRRDGEALDQAREGARSAFNWDAQVTKCSSVAMLARLEAAVNQDGGRAAILEFYSHVRKMCHLLAASFNYITAINLLQVLLVHPSINSADRKGAYLKPKLLVLKRWLYQGANAFQQYMAPYLADECTATAWPAHLFEYWNFKRARLDEIRSQFEDRWDTKDKLESKEVKLDVNNTKLDVKERRPDSTFDSATFIRNQRQFNKRIIKFTSELLDNAFSICGDAPEEFCVFALGSLSRLDALSYSDLEYGLLRETNDPANDAYFDALLVLFHVQVLLVGKAGDGYRIDDGVHPLTLVEGGAKRLHGTMEQLTECFRDEALPLGDKISNSLLHTQFLFASANGATLLRALRAEIKTCLARRLDLKRHEFNGFSIRRARALVHLRPITNMLRKSDGSIKALSDLYHYHLAHVVSLDLKKYIVEPLKYFVLDLASFHSIDDLSPQQSLERLAHKSVITARLRGLLSRSLANLEAIRNRIHRHRGGQAKAEIVWIKLDSQASTSNLNRNDSTTSSSATSPSNAMRHSKNGLMNSNCIASHALPEEEYTLSEEEIAELQYIYAHVIQPLYSLMSELGEIGCFLNPQLEEEEDRLKRTSSSYSQPGTPPPGKAGPGTTPDPLKPAVSQAAMLNKVSVYSYEGNLEKLKEILVGNEGLVNQYDHRGGFPLYNASARGHLDVVYYLLTLPAVKINQPHTGERSLGSTALHAASFHGHELVVGLLLLAGANAEIENKFGLTSYREAGIKVRQIFDLYQKGGKKALKKKFPSLETPKVVKEKKQRL